MKFWLIRKRIVLEYRLLLFLPLLPKIFPRDSRVWRCKTLLARKSRAGRIEKLESGILLLAKYFIARYAAKFRVIALIMALHPRAPMRLRMVRKGNARTG